MSAATTPLQSATIVTPNAGGAVTAWTRTHDPGIMRAQATLAAVDFRLQESAGRPLQSTLITLFDAISHHDRHHVAESNPMPPRRRVEEGVGRLDLVERPPPAAGQTSDSSVSSDWVWVVLVIPVVAQRRLGPTISAKTRCAVRLPPVSLSVQASGGDGAADEDPVSLGAPDAEGMNRGSPPREIGRAHV